MLTPPTSPTSPWSKNQRSQPSAVRSRYFCANRGSRVARVERTVAPKHAPCAPAAAPEVAGSVRVVGPVLSGMVVTVHLRPLPRLQRGGEPDDDTTGGSHFRS